MAKTTTRRSARGSRGGPSGPIVWILWLIVIVLLAIIARYAFIAAQPDRTGYTLFGREGSLRPQDQPSANADEKRPANETRSGQKDYSRKDRAKLDQLVDEVAPPQR